jgi:hypothetical protein
MLADGCPSALLARTPLLVMLAVPYLSIPDADLLFLVQVLPSRGPVRLLHRLARDELFFAHPVSLLIATSHNRFDLLKR